MTQQQKMTMLRFLYSNDKAQTFLCNDLFQEFANIIPKIKCISDDNILVETRERNYIEVLLSIREFFTKNLDYKIIVKDIFSHYKENELEEHLLIGFVFYISLINNDNNIDIFKDKKSICYSKGPALYEIIL